MTLLTPTFHDQIYENFCNFYHVKAGNKTYAPTKQFVWFLSDELYESNDNFAPFDEWTKCREIIFN